MKLPSAGAVGWVALAGSVWLWDATAPESLSHAFGRAPKPLTAIVWAVTTAHLFGCLPKKYDPFYRFVERKFP